MRRLAARYELSVFCRRVRLHRYQEISCVRRARLFYFFISRQRNHRRHADKRLLEVVPREMA